jgi:lipopolysaccharide/colanic/teichoic acid biosynthesis glycosyltransferase
MMGLKGSQENLVTAVHSESAITSDAHARQEDLGLARHTKRAFDIIAASISLLLLSPILFITSVAIKLDSRGPIFSREIQYGYKNRTIHVFKFRSTRASPKANYLNSDVTRVGRVIRQTGIAELPELLNVLRGDMSIVGPRLHAHRRDQFAYDLMPLRNDFKPGITGLTRLAELREGPGTTDQNFNYDLHYVENWSNWLDLKIIMMTVISKKIYASTTPRQPVTN